MAARKPKPSPHHRTKGEMVVDWRAVPADRPHLEPVALLTGAPAEVLVERRPTSTTVTFPPLEVPARIDAALASALPFLSRTRIQELIAQRLLLLNGQPVERPSEKVFGGETCILDVPPRPKPDLVAEDIPLDIIFEDADLIVINKPAGLVCHPAPGNYTGTLVAALLHHVGALPGGDAIRPGLVHRLDKDTSGLLVVAKTDEALATLQRYIKARTVKREYIAWAWGAMRGDAGSFTQPIGRDPADRRRRAINVPDARPAETHWRVEQQYAYATRLAIRLGTGRTHQIRVHLSAQGHSIIGDVVYAGDDRALRGIAPTWRQHAAESLALVTRQALHAWRLRFPHPRTDEPLTFEAPWPADLVRLDAHLAEAS